MLHTFACIMGAISRPPSISERFSEREADPHQSVTVAPPASHLEQMLQQATPSSLPAQGDRSVRTALDAGARASSNLSRLSGLVADLSAGVALAESANERLLQELGALQAALGSAHDRQRTLEQRVAQLEQELAEARLEGERQRRSLTEQHDAFLAALLEEHETALAAARLRDDGARENRNDSHHPESGREGHAHSDPSRRVPQIQPRPLYGSEPPLGGVPARTFEPRGPEDEAAPSGWTPLPLPPAVIAPLRRISAATLPDLPTPLPVLKARLDPATRPLTDYSLGEEDTSSETLEGARLSSSPPRK